MPNIMEEEQELESIECHPKLLLRNHAVQKVSDKYDRIETFNSKRVLFSIHPTKALMASVGADKFLCIWDTHNHKMPERIELVTQPTCVKWNNDGTLLFVGLLTGNLIVYQLSDAQMGGTRTTYDKTRQTSKF